MTRTVVIAWVLGAVLGAAGVVLADGARVTPSAAGVSSRPGQPSHGWFVTFNRPGQLTLAHVPPRRRAGGDGVLRGAANGVITRAADLDEMPLALAAWDDRVYVVFERQGPVGRRVGSLTARPTPTRDRWRMEPPGELKVEPSLPGGGDLEGLAATSMGLAALTRDGRGGPSYELRILDGRSWSAADLPPAIREKARDGRPQLVGMGDRLGLLRRRAGGTVDLWIGTRAPGVPRARVSAETREEDPERQLEFSTPAPEPARLDLRWTLEHLAADGSAPDLDGAWTQVFLSGGRVHAALADAGGVVRVVALVPGTSQEVARIEGVGPRAGVVGLELPSRVVAAWFVEPPGSAGPEGHGATGGVGAGARGVEAPFEVREVSLVDGRTEYAGPIVGDAPLSPREVQWLALSLVVLMGVVLLVVLRADPSADTYRLPPGASLAPSARRMLAGLIDLAAAVVLAARVMGVSASELADPSFVVSERSLVFVGVVVAAGIVLGTIGEALLGRSPGKFMTVCEVIDVRLIERAARPRLWQALVRNLVKWVLSPAAMLGLLEPQGRHRGDSLSRTAVVVFEEPGDDEEPGE